MSILTLLWQWRKLIALGVVAICISTLLWRCHAWREAYKALPAVQSSLELEQACGEGSKCQERQKALEAAAEAKSAEVVGGLEKEIASLRARPVERRVIRVCNDRGVQGSGAAGAADAAGPAAGELHGAVEFDLGPLRELAREADEQVALRRALMEWNRALSAQ